ncbi:L,D-transpeptidase family protein [Paradevosia shaoguanensis]|uniref:L,D-transpeptidase family protein n=1 Tax=Paradevosia shaoguanensis TaxID=1335043 RepID=UPI001933EE1B|nr:murein L,D-transpeptidase family protein [Paradevosia shaoguanensis]
MSTGLFRKLAAAALLVGVAVTLSACGGFIGKGNAKANRPLTSAAVTKLASMGSSPGAPMMVRIFKESSELEVWKQTSAGDFRLFKTYEICAYSGDLGPKIKEGDRQSPEGFYTITPGLMNPNSSYYLAFNTGFPNKFDRAYGRTGSDLMVHGDCSSRGCYAMTDEGIAEIYALARETFKGGNPSFQLQIFPFRMTPQNLAKQSKSPNMAFWKNIKEGYDQFEIAKIPPRWDVCDRRYVFNATGPAGTPLDAVAACPALSQDATMVAALKAKQAADDATFETEVAYVSKKESAAVAAAERDAATQAAAKARGEAIGGFFNGIGSNIGNLFGNTPQEAAPVETATAAPVPAAKS